MIIKQVSGIPQHPTRQSDLANAEDPTDPGFITANQLHEKEKRRGVMNWIFDGISWCFVTLGSVLMIVGLWFASIGEKEAKDE